MNDILFSGLDDQPRVTDDLMHEVETEMRRLQLIQWEIDVCHIVRAKEGNLQQKLKELKRTFRNISEILEL